MLAPWPASEELQSGTSTFKPFVCLRHLALIEMVDKTFTDLRHEQNTLLQELATYRAKVLSDMQEKRSVKQHMAEWKQEQTRIDPEDEHCYRELCRRIDLMLFDPLRERPSDWWTNAGIIFKPQIPVFCTETQGKKQKQGKVSLTLMHYLLAHVLLDDVF